VARPNPTVNDLERDTYVFERKVPRVHEDGPHGQSVARISGVANGPMGSGFEVDINSITYPGPWQNRPHDHG
jgi:hypothetical protein